MNPRSFPNGRTAYGEEEREAINMSLDSPDSPEEAEANAKSPSLDPDYEPNGEAEMILDKAEADQINIDSSEYVTPRSISPSRGQSPSPPALTAFFSQVRAPGTNPQFTPASLAESKKRREEEVRRARARRRHLGQAYGSSEA